VAGFLISALGGSRVQIGGPTGAFIVVVYEIVQTHGFQGLLVATLMAGVILVLAGLFRAGRLIALVPEAVIEGFTIGIAIVIATSQLKDLLGLSTGPLPADFVEKVPALWAARDTLNLSAFMIGLGTIAVIFGLRRLSSRVPGAVIAVAVTSGAAMLLLLRVDTVGSIYGALPNGLPWPHLPPLSVATMIELLPSALVIAFLAGVESLLSAIVADRMIGGAHRSNAELLAQGAANIASPLFGGLPATGAIARTATNVRAGGRTPVAGIVHALTIAAIMAFAAPLAGFMAMSALAGLLVVTAWTMAEPHRWPERLRAPAGDRFLMFLTMVLTVFSDLTVAIAVGTGIGLALRLLRQNAPPEEWQPPER
jgi:SulP family sulfate permease